MHTDLQTFQSGPPATRPEPPYADPGVPSDSHAFKSFVATALRHRGKLTAAFLIPLTAAVALSFIPAKTYEAEARLLALIGHEYIFRPEVGEAGAGMALDATSITKSEVEILRSRTLKEEVVEAIGPIMLYPELAEPPRPSLSGTLIRAIYDAAAQTGVPLPEWPHSTDATVPTLVDGAVMAVSDNLTVEPIKDSSVIRVAFRHTDRELAARTVNRLIDAYFARRLGILGRSQADALAGTYNEVNERLKATDAELDRFKDEYQVIDFGHQTTLMLQQRAGLEDASRKVEAELVKARERLADLKHTLAATPREVTLYTSNELFAAYQHAQGALNLLEAERAALLTRLMESHPKVITIDRQIAQLRTQLSRTPRTDQTKRVGINPVHEQTQRQIAEVQAEVASLEGMSSTIHVQLAAFDKRIDTLRLAERRYRSLVREQTVLLESQHAYAKRLEETRILDELGRDRNDNVRLIQAALPPIEGHSLRGMIRALGALSGLILSLFLAFLLEAARRVFVIPQNAASALGMPILATVPVLSRQERRRLDDVHRQVDRNVTRRPMRATEGAPLFATRMREHR